MEKSIKLNWEKCYSYIVELTEKVVHSKYDPQVILGIPRGGAVVATLMSYILNFNYKIIHDLLFFPFKYPPEYSYNEEFELTLNFQNVGKFLKKIVENKRVLIVDDSAYSSSTIKAVKDEMFKLGANNVKSAVIALNKDRCDEQPDFYCLETIKLVKYPWKLGSNQLYNITEISKRFNLRFQLHIKDVNVSEEIREAILNGYKKELKDVFPLKDGFLYTDNKVGVEVTFINKTGLVLKMILCAIGNIDFIEGKCIDFPIRVCNEIMKNKPCYECCCLNSLLSRAYKLLQLLKKVIIEFLGYLPEITIDNIAPNILSLQIQNFLKSAK